MKEITYSKDQVVFRQGDDARNMFDISSGKIGIYQDYGTDHEKKIAELESGEIFGEMGMIEYYPRSATAVVLSDSAVLQELGEDDLKEYFKDKPEKLLRLMRLLSRRIRETTEKYVDVCRTVSEGRKVQKNLNEYASFYSGFWVK